MPANDLIKLRHSVKLKKPLIHCITNPISINQCANAVLFTGAKPIMAEHPKEVSQITKTASALMLNLGNITDARMESMLISAQTANENNIPCILDAVGISCSDLRRNFAYELTEKNSFTAIKGNYSEINALLNPDYNSKGVDSENLDLKSISKTAVKLSKKYNSIILASGKTDIITDGKKLIYIKNGTKELSSVTGTGCMLASLGAVYLSVCKNINAITCACAVLGISGELSKTDKGFFSFMINLMDNLSTLSDEDFKKYLNLEECKIEKL